MLLFLLLSASQQTAQGHADLLGVRGDRKEQIELDAATAVSAPSLFGQLKKALEEKEPVYRGSDRIRIIFPNERSPNEMFYYDVKPTFFEGDQEDLPRQDTSYHKPSCKHAFYFKELKTEDEHPENEFFCYSLYKVFGIEKLIAPICLVKIERSDGAKQWMQVSKKAGEQNLEEYLKVYDVSSLRKDDICCHSIMSLLLNLGDAKTANYIVSPAGRLISIDHEMAFRMPVVYYQNRGSLSGVISFTFLEQFESFEISDSVKAIFSKFSPEEIVEKWLKEADEFSLQYKFFTEQQSSLQILWSFWLKKIFEITHQKDHIERIYGAFKKKGETINLGFLLEQCEPRLHNYFMKKSRGAPEQEITKLMNEIIYEDKKTKLSIKEIQSSLLDEGQLNLLLTFAHLFEKPGDLHKAGVMHHFGIGVPQDYKKAFEFFHKSATRDPKHPESALYVPKSALYAAVLCLMPFVNIPEGLDKAEAYLNLIPREASCFKDRMLIYFYLITETNYNKEKSIECCFNYLVEELTQEEDSQEADKKLKKIAEKRKDLHKFFLRYAQQQCQLHNYKEALKYYEIVAQAGSVVGQFKAATIYEKGRKRRNRVHRNLKKSRYYYQKAADQGYAPARQKLIELSRQHASS